MPNVKRVVEYYLTIPEKHVFLIENNSPNSIKFSEFSDKTLFFDKDEAIKLAERYNLSIHERTTVTTTEVTEKIL